MINVLIVDDQDMVRQGLEVILGNEAEIKIVGTAKDGQEAIDLAEKLQPQVILMDLKMPRLNGIQATREITRKFPEMKVVVLTTYDGDEWLFDAIRAGALSYLLKDGTSDEIVQTVLGAAEGEVRLDPAIAGKVIQEFNRLASLAAAKPKTFAAKEHFFEDLSERELSVLQEIVNGKTNREIAETLFLAEGTVKNYVSSIITKLQANDRTQAAILALKHGLAKLE